MGHIASHQLILKQQSLLLYLLFWLLLHSIHLKSFLFLIIKSYIMIIKYTNRISICIFYFLSLFMIILKYSGNLELNSMYLPVIG